MIAQLLAAAAFILLAQSMAMADDVKVFAAASLRNALDGIGQEWSKSAEGRSMTGVYAGSPALARQIIEGAPADIFISADLAWMDELEKQDQIDLPTRRNVAGNELVLIAPANAAAAVEIARPETIMKALGDGRLVIADVKSVPAGRYGKAALEHFGVWHLLEPRLAQTENARAALAFVARGEAPLGIVYASDAKEEPGVSVVAAFPPQSHPPIVYPAARVKASVNPDAMAFLDFLTSAAGQKIFASHGFLPAP